MHTFSAAFCFFVLSQDGRPNFHPFLLLPVDLPAQSSLYFSPLLHCQYRHSSIERNMKMLQCTTYSMLTTGFAKRSIPDVLLIAGADSLSPSKTRGAATCRGAMSTATWSANMFDDICKVCAVINCLSTVAMGAATCSGAAGVSFYATPGRRLR